MIKISFVNYGNADRHAWKLAFNGTIHGDQESFKCPQLARMEAQKYFDRLKGDVRQKYTIDASSYYAALESLR